MDVAGLIPARFGVVFLAIALVACDGEAPRDTVRLQVEKAPDYMQPAVAGDTEAGDLTENAQATVDRLEQIIETNSIYRLARFADTQPGFISNFAGASHRTHWDLLRRTGFDPILRLEDLLSEPHGMRAVGNDTWYVWPDFAALDPVDLQLERLTFRQRARLEELVGEAGIESIRQGNGYPGVRTAIASDGRWLYFVHESQDEE